jgi:hypothetical protein
MAESVYAVVLCLLGAAAMHILTKKLPRPLDFKPARAQMAKCSPFVLHMHQLAKTGFYWDAWNTSETHLSSYP